MSDRLLPLLGRDGAIEALVLISTHVQIILHDVKHPDHLAEDKDTVPILAQPSKKLVKQDHLATAHDDALQRLFVGVGLDLGAIEQPWMVGSLLQLHGYFMVR